jgi:perosamine synthetase
MIPIYKPYISKYKASALKAIESEWISNYGIYTTLANTKLCEILGSKYCVLTCNGTAATHCLFLALRYKYPYIKKIYVPNNVFVSPWNCALMEYNDISVMKMDPTTLNIDTTEEYWESLESDSAVLIVHNLGNIVNVPRLKRFRPDLIFIEDNCEGLFGKYEGRYSGTASLCSSVSFYSNKVITTGEGGAFLTNDLDLYSYIMSIHSHGMTDERYVHNELAYNYRMTNIEAALLYDQLNDIKHIIECKKSVFNRYDVLLAELYQMLSIRKFKQELNTDAALWMYTIIIPNNNYKKLEQYMNEKQIQIRPCLTFPFHW